MRMIKSLSPKGSFAATSDHYAVPRGSSLSLRVIAVDAPQSTFPSTLEPAEHFEQQKIPRLISSPSPTSLGESIICGFPNHIQQTGIHLVVFRKTQRNVLCLTLSRGSLSRDLQAEEKKEPKKK